MAPLRAVRASIVGRPAGEIPPTIVAPVEPRRADHAVLDRMDDTHGILRRPGEAGMVVLILPADRTSGTPGSPDAVTLEVVVAGWRLEVLVEDAARAAVRERARRGRVAPEVARAAEVRAIIPGRIAAVAVVPDQPVSRGDPLLVIEAMKMQNELRASRDGTVTAVAVRTGQTVEAGDLLVVIE